MALIQPANGDDATAIRHTIQSFIKEIGIKFKMLTLIISLLDELILEEFVKGHHSFVTGNLSLRTKGKEFIRFSFLYYLLPALCLEPDTAQVRSFK